MSRYIYRRLLLMIPVILGVSFLIYFIMDLAGGDVTTILGGNDLTVEQLEALRESLGLNRPFIVRYADYMLHFFQGDLGVSYLSNIPVWQLFWQRFPATLELAFAATLLNVALSLPLGITSARNHGTLADNACQVGGLLGLSIPPFWLGLMLISLFAVKLRWLPTQGNEHGLMSLILPAITLGAGLMASTTRTTRSSMLDAIRQDYLRTARAKGVPENIVINKHALRNALIPIITTFGSQFAALLGGAALTEAVFSWPGIGRLVVDSVYNRDTPVVTGCMILITIIIGLVQLAIDIVYAFIDPRIKAQYARGGKKRG